ncbi:phosphotransferase family protein [Fusarium oxysporum f. sp. phaseoli]
MEMVVERKMNDAKERVLVDWDPATAKQLLQEALGDYSGSQS